MEKVNVTKEQAEVIKRANGAETESLFLEAHVKNNFHPDNRCLKNLTLDELAKALYIGYEVEQTKEERLLREYELATDTGFSYHTGIRDGIKITLDIYGIEIEGINK